jgi:hypothetical protein
LVGAVPARVVGEVKLVLLGVIEQAVDGGWTFGRICRLLGVGERRARDGQARAAAGLLEDRRPGAALHGLRPQEVQAINRMAEAAGGAGAADRPRAR